MAVNKNEFLDFAKNLPGDSEINNRNAVSRAYYAAYHTCLEKFSPAQSAAGGVHAKLIDGLIKSPSSADRQIGYILKDIKDRRTISDYFLAEEVTLADRQKAVISTEKLIALVDN